MNYTERIYSESEIKLIKEIFEMYIKQIYDEDLVKLVSDCKEMFLENQELLKEIKRLNNIINAIEKALILNIEDLKEYSEMQSRVDEDKEILRFIKELKDVDKK